MADPSCALRVSAPALDKAETFESPQGLACQVAVAGRDLALGNETLMEPVAVRFEILTSQAESLGGDGASVVHLAADGRLLGLLAVSDPIKESSLRPGCAEECGTPPGDGDRRRPYYGPFGCGSPRIDEVHGEVRRRTSWRSLNACRKRVCVAMAGTD